MNARLTDDAGDRHGPSGRDPGDPYGPSGFRASLRAMAADAPAAPGLFDAVAEGARRRHAARVRTGSALVVAGMVAAGAAWWGNSSHETDPDPRPSATKPSALGTPSKSPTFPTFPALACPAIVAAPRTQGGSDRLLNGTSAYAATLCETSGGKVTAVPVAPLDVLQLMQLLKQAPAIPVNYCYPDEDPVPKSSLILRFSDKPDQELLVAGMTCGIVTNGAYTVVTPDYLLDLLGGPKSAPTGTPR